MSTIRQTVCSALPPLDPNGQPISMMLRGSLAELGELRTILMDLNIRRQLMQMHELDVENENNVDDEFGDAEQDAHLAGMPNESWQKDPGDVSTTASINNCTKRIREEEDTDHDDNEEDNIDDAEETLLLFLPSVQCTCSSWNMKNTGDLIVTSLRILFVAAENSESEDVAVDGRCIALHAVDSNEEGHDSLAHVYCQLSDPGCESRDVYNSGIGMMASPNILVEYDNQSESGDEMQEGTEDNVYDDNEVVEVYLKPMICEHVADKEQHAETCQRLFASLTKLASLNPGDDDDDGYGGGGGLFNMLSLMAGMGNVLDGDGRNHADEIEFRNNFVEADEESEGAPEDERHAMLNRLDNMLIVPPEYEIATSEEEGGQFEDAEEDDDDLL